MARILIVEDEHPINNLIAKSLALTGHTPVCAYDGDTALEIIRSEPPDLAILDVMLTGFDLIKDPLQLLFSGFRLSGQGEEGEVVIGVQALMAPDHCINDPVQIIVISMFNHIEKNPR